MKDLDNLEVSAIVGLGQLYKELYPDWKRTDLERFVQRHLADFVVWWTRDNKHRVMPDADFAIVNWWNNRNKE